MPGNVGGTQPPRSDWPKFPLMAGGAGLWEWDHRAAVARLCDGAALLLAGSARLAWRDLPLPDALANVHPDDVDRLHTTLQDMTYPRSAQLGQFRIGSQPRTAQRVLMRGRTQLAENGEPGITRGVVIDITDAELAQEEWFSRPYTDATDEAAHHAIAAYNAIQATGNTVLIAPARALLLAIGREIATRMRDQSLH